MSSYSIRQIFSADGPLANIFRDFEERDGQIEMAEEVYSTLMAENDDIFAEDFVDGCIAKANILVVEAETGIGKTLAYLIPAIISGKRVVVSTATLNLQDQIIEKDLPLVERLVGQKLSYSCVKGRENYLCLYRWYQYQSTPQLSLVEDQRIAKIDNWLKTTTTGDRSELWWLGEKSPFWAKISASSSQCLGSDCPEYGECFITRLRKQAGSAHLLIVNHHLFFSDLALKGKGYGEILPRYEAVIFDEAHHIENVASTFFGKTFSHYQILDLVRDIEQQAELELLQDRKTAIIAEAEGLKKRVEDFAGIFPQKRGRYQLEPVISECGTSQWEEDVELVKNGLLRLGEDLKKHATSGESWNLLATRAEDMAKMLVDIALQKETEKDQCYVRWYERRERTILLTATPLEVSDLLINNLYNKVESCILTSATLSSGGSFSYMQKRLGLDEDTPIRQFASPFDYQGRTMIYVPDSDFPEPMADAYPEQVGRQILEILYMSRGRALVLCTSFRGMDDIADVLRAHLDYPVLVQGTEARNILLSKFRNETHSVLVAVASFWEGVDVAGESLSCVVIDKLPFEVPSDPVLQARIDKIKKDGGNPFFGFQVPRAVLTLRQGVGRLMRSAADSGVVAIMDVRLFKKGYGKTFLRSLPPAKVTRRLEDVDMFFKRDKV